ncbi:hypothetical protein PAMP_008907 [Pampus punctatissimus]
MKPGSNFPTGPRLAHPNPPFAEPFPWTPSLDRICRDSGPKKLKARLLHVSMTKPHRAKRANRLLYSLLHFSCMLRISIEDKISDVGSAGVWWFQFDAAGGRQPTGNSRFCSSQTLLFFPGYPLDYSKFLGRGDPGKEKYGWTQALSIVGQRRASKGESFFPPLCPQVAKLRQQLQKRSRHAPPSAGYELPHHPLPAGHTAGITQTMPLMPLNRLAPRLRRSVEGLNLELEEVFVSEKPVDQHEILDIPDGHRAPVPAQRCSSGSQSEPSPGPLDHSLLSPSQSPCPLDPSLLSPSNSPCPLNPSLLSPSQSPCPMGEPGPVYCEILCPSPSTLFPSLALDPPLLQPCSTSPRPNKTYTFQREPPEGCERVRVCEEAMSACQDESLLQPSCPDPNKVNFTPHGGSAFCPVSLLKPLLPSMDLLFRGLSVSPVTGCPGQASPTRHLGMQ